MRKYFVMLLFAVMAITVMPEISLAEEVQNAGQTGEVDGAEKLLTEFTQTLGVWFEDFIDNTVPAVDAWDGTVDNSWNSLGKYPLGKM